MGLYDRLKALFSFPPVETARYRCVNCGTTVETDEAACPECGGEMEALSYEPIELYWPHH